MKETVKEALQGMKETVQGAVASNNTLIEMIKADVNNQNERTDTLVGMIQAEVHNQNARMNSIDSKLDGIRWWILGTGVGIAALITALVYTLYEANNNTIQAILQLMAQLTE